MTTHNKRQGSDNTCNAGPRCGVCCELIPSGSTYSTHSREIDEVIYHFCGPECYQRWQQRGIEHSSSD